MNLSSLSREEKLRLYDLIQEKKRRILEKKPVYKPNSGQLPVHLDEKPIRMVAAGNGGGKTTLAVQELVWWGTGYNPILKSFTKVPATIVVLLDSPMKVEEVWLTEIRKWYPLDKDCTLHKNGKPYVNEIRFKNGSKVLFLFHEQDDLLFEGIQIDYLIADEPFPRRIWIALTRGARKKNSNPKFLLTGTPLGQPWMYQELWKAAAEGERDDIGLHRFSTEVNRANLADGYIERFSRNLSEAEKKVRLDGHFSHLGGLALAHLFNRSVHIVPYFDWPRHKPAIFILDPHMSKPHTASLIGTLGDGRIYWIAEMKTKSPPKKAAREFVEFCRGFRIIDYIMDSLGETPRTGGEGNLSFGDVLRREGLPVRSTSFDDKNDEMFIQRIQQVLEIPDQPDNFGRKIPKFAIIEGNPGIVNDIETVQWMKYRNHDIYKDKLDITSKDYLSLLKYGLSSSLIHIADRGHAPKIFRSRRSPWSGYRRSN